jgi:hypothetical protein
MAHPPVVMGHRPDHYTEPVRVVISVPSGPSTFVGQLGPPVEVGRRADAVRPSLQGDAVGQWGVFERVDVGGVAVDEDLISQEPQMLGGLEFQVAGWEEEDPHVFADPKPRGCCP